MYRKSATTTPRQKLRQTSPKAKLRRSSPNQSQLMKALSSIKSEPDSISPIQITPVSKIQYAKKDMNVGKNFDKYISKPDKTAKVDRILDKAYKNIDKITNTESSKDLNSIGNFDSRGPESVKEFDSSKEFDSIVRVDSKCPDSVKDFDSGKENATNSKEGREMDAKVADSPRYGTKQERDGSRSDREKNKVSFTVVVVLNLSK